MKKITLIIFVVFLFTVVSTSFAYEALDIEIETESIKDEAKAVTESSESLMYIADPLDATFLFTMKPGSLVIYNTAVSDDVFMVTGVGDDVVEISAENLGVGDFVFINTAEPDGCTTMTITECRAQSDFITEQSFSISFDKAPVIVEEILKENSTTTSITADLSEGETVTASIDKIIVEDVVLVDTNEITSPSIEPIIEPEPQTEILDTVTEDVVEEVAPTSSVIENENINDTTTTTF